MRRRQRITRSPLGVLLAVGLLAGVVVAVTTLAGPAVRAEAATADGLVGYWPLDLGSADVDRSGSGNPLTFGDAGGLSDQAAPTRFANPTAFRSINDPRSFATATGTNIDNLTDYTLSFWVRLNARPTTVVNLVSLEGRSAVQIDPVFGAQLAMWQAFAGRPGATRTDLYTGPDFTLGRYHHLAVAVRATTDAVLYLDGQPIRTAPVVSGPPGRGVRIAGGDGAAIDGNIDDVRVYDHALHPDAVAELSFACAKVTDIPVAECDALRDLYNSTGGPGWTDAKNWFQTTSACSWFGVLCGNGHVVALVLPNNNLSGALPASIAGLGSLLVLQLPDNHLSGSLPAALGSLRALATLDLYDNRLSGAIPAELGQLARLSTLRLHNNALTGEVPASLAALSGLVTIDVGFNALTAGAVAGPYLAARQPDWAATQTVAPTGLRFSADAAVGPVLSWTPIAYGGDGGGYTVLRADQPAGPFTVVGVTAGKAIASMPIGDLKPGATYSFAVFTSTPAHGVQQNALKSANSAVLTAPFIVTHAPVAANDAYNAQQDTVLRVDAAHGVLANDRDADGDRLVIGSISTANPGAKLALNPDGSFSYTPAAGFSGVDTFRYRASDGTLLSNEVTITFTVAKTPPAPATITIALTMTPAGPTNVRFSGGLGSFVLDDVTPQDRDAFTRTKTFTVPAGTYSVTEVLPTGFLDANISCNPPAGSVADLAQHQISVTVAPGAKVVCTFDVQRAARIVAGAYNDRNRDRQRQGNEPWLAGWTMQRFTPPDPNPVSQSTDNNGRTTFSNLFAGTYQICEQLKSGWQSTSPGSLDPTRKSPCATVTVAAGQTVWVRFGNATTPATSPGPVPSGRAGVADVITVNPVPTDDGGRPTAAERDPWA